MIQLKILWKSEKKKKKRLYFYSKALQSSETCEFIDLRILYQWEKISMHLSRVNLKPCKSTKKKKNQVCSFLFHSFKVRMFRCLWIKCMSLWAVRTQLVFVVSLNTKVIHPANLPSIHPISLCPLYAKLFWVSIQENF